ncbi:MAG TPA: TetR/AcrR family transcriptional regulator [Solirubrobacteraceae bacterium]|nr:TetR/AcrR family transcriptional regulator [Solirubrobacteraceae bacterium]
MSSTSPKAKRQPHQLRPGRHGLSREAVAEHQRGRIRDAVSQVVSEKGYVAMTVEDVIAVAGVSRRTFYDHFKGKEAAYLEAFEVAGAELIRRVREAYAQSRSLAGGVVACLRAFLEFSAEQPRYAEMCLVEVLAAGPVAIERRDAVLRTLAGVLHEGAESDPRSAPTPPMTAEWVIGGVYEIVYAQIITGRTRRLPELLPDLAYSIMLAYLGSDVALELTHRFTGEWPTGLAPA